MVNNVLETLVESIKNSLQQQPVEVAVDSIEQAIKLAIAKPNLLPDECRTSSPDKYKRHILHVNSDLPFTVMSLVWLPGQESPVHGHQAWCVVGIVEGDLTIESFTERDDSKLECSGSFTAGPGRSCIELPGRGDIHRIANRGDRKAVSLHVYGKDLSDNSCEINEYYDYKDCA